MATLLLALRNLQRNRRRSIATLLAMIVGVCAILLFGGFTTDITLGLQSDIVRNSGHLQIQRRGYYLFGSGNSRAYGIRDYTRIVQALQGDPALRSEVTVITPTLELGGVAGNFDAGVTRTVVVEGAIATDQARMQQWDDYGLGAPAASSPLAGTQPDAAVAGFGLARVLKLCEPLHLTGCASDDVIADHPAGASASTAPSELLALVAAEAPARPAAPQARIDVLAAAAQGAPNVGSFDVVGVAQQGVKEFDDIYLAVHLPRAQRLVYGGGEPRVTAIEVQLRHTAQLPMARERIRQILAASFGDQPLDVQDFETLNPSYGQTNSMFSVIFGFMFALVSSIVLFVVGNTMSTAVVERTVEIGTLRAMGMRRRGIQKLFVCEGLMLGVLVAVGIAAVVNHSGLTWTPPARVDSVPLSVRVWGEWRQIGLVFGCLSLVAALSAWWPSHRAARLSVVDALRHV
ncbi:ABC transporter permease [Paraburkholderia bannensis]|uniref:ABC transporter permease n=1 Tax=Paraburkholderia bannensis TaxID=765414 RepID=UPI0004843559|nr:FtsX-like permease family protein [Paraburkholderia bannensis]